MQLGHVAVKIPKTFNELLSREDAIVVFIKLMENLALLLCFDIIHQLLDYVNQKALLNFEFRLKN